MFIATSLSHYKRADVQKAIVAQAEEKEISVIFDKTQFGKRPDIISYEQDVLDFAKKKVSSFHCSEELWYNPLSIQTGMKRHELDELRKGWDFILDVDCPQWDVSRIITHLFIRALEDHGIKSITVKFSGNKGFHIAVPFEAFPENISFEGKMRPTKELFPELPRKMAIYLLSYVTGLKDYVFVDEGNARVVFLNEYVYSFEELDAIASKSNQTLFARRCVDCKKSYKNFQEQKPVYYCSSCGHISKPQGSPDIINCERCNAPVPFALKRSTCSHCGSTKRPESYLNMLAVVEMDTVLLASRHLYRMPYSLHEKSGLVSLPIRAAEVLTFDKARAKPDAIAFTVPFLDRKSASSAEGGYLLQKAIEKELSDIGHIHADIQSRHVEKKDIALPETAIAKEHFPPCMRYIDQPLEDGKKRALFVLLNFLRVSGWSVEAVEDYVYTWNEAHPEPLREQYIKGQLHQIKKGKKPLPPPNCANKDYYVSLGFCHPDGLCKRINNPAMYAKRKHELAASKPKKSSRKNAKKASKKGKKE